MWPMSWKLPLFVAAFVFASGCGRSTPPHNVDKNGVKHAAGLEQPLDNCTDCHGQDLKGGVGPSCFTCHDALWEK